MAIFFSSFPVDFPVVQATPFDPQAVQPNGWESWYSFVCQCLEKARVWDAKSQGPVNTRMIMRVCDKCPRAFVLFNRYATNASFGAYSVGLEDIAVIQAAVDDLQVTPDFRSEGQVALFHRLLTSPWSGPYCYVPSVINVESIHGACPSDVMGLQCKLNANTLFGKRFGPSFKQFETRKQTETAVQGTGRPKASKRTKPTNRAFNDACKRVLSSPGQAFVNVQTKERAHCGLLQAKASGPMSAKRQTSERGDSGREVPSKRSSLDGGFRFGPGFAQRHAAWQRNALASNAKRARPDGGFDLGPDFDPTQCYGMPNAKRAVLED
jgi:hypothetical protein